MRANVPWFQKEHAIVAGFPKNACKRTRVLERDMQTYQGFQRHEANVPGFQEEIANVLGFAKKVCKFIRVIERGMQM